MDLSQSALQAIGAVVDGKISAALMPVTNKLDTMDKRMDAQEDRLLNVEKQINEMKAGSQTMPLAQASNAGRFVPTHVEIKGICEWKDRKTNGINRDEAEILVAKLKEKLPQSMKPKVGELEIYGARGHKFKVHVSPPGAVEVSLIWKELLRDDASLQYNGKILWTTAEREPADQKRFSVGGKARAYLEAKAKEKESTATSSCSWKPSFVLTVKGSRGATTVGSVQENGTIAWEDEGLLGAFGVTAEVAKKELDAFQQA